MLPASSGYNGSLLVRRSTRGSSPSSFTECDPARRWFRVKSAAHYLGIGAGTLNKMRLVGNGPAYSKLGHTVVYDIADLDRWATERRVRSTSERPAAA